MAKDRIALDASLTAAVTLVLASVTLLLLEDSNAQDVIYDNYLRRIGAGLPVSRTDVPGPPRIRDEEMELIFVLVGLGLSLIGVAFARRAWKRWVRSSDTLAGVVIALALTALSGVVGLLFLTDLSQYVFDPGT
jgi:hypothetical protein